MEKRERYVAAAVFLAVAVIGGAWWYFNSQHDDSNAVRVHEDPAFAAALQDFNTVVLRLYAPFTDMSGPGAAITYAIQVFIFARKTVIFQTIEGNKCTRVVYTPSESGVPDKNTTVINPIECEAESTIYPTIEIRQAPDNSIYQTDLLTTVSGRPEDIPSMVRFVIIKAYPNADQVIARTRQLLSSLR